MSVIVAIAVGGIEGLGLLAAQTHLQGVFWDLIGGLNENFGVLGYVIIGVFLLSWMLSVCIYKWRRYDDLEQST
jgi:high-affinity nickel-transport protein